RQRGLERQLPDTLGQVELVAARRRPEDHGAVAPLRAARRALARAAGALLPPRLLAAAGDLADLLGVVRTLAALGELPADDARDQVGARRQAEHLVGEVDVAGRGVVESLDCDFHDRPSYAFTAPMPSLQLETARPWAARA